MIDEFVIQNNIPKYRIDQFNDQYYKHAICSFDQLTNWPKDLRDKLKEEVPFNHLEVVEEFASQTHDTTKVLFKRVKDGLLLEAVLMSYKDGRNSICVSCMVGCPVNCTFCATGKMGFKAMLSADEIIDQILYFKRKLKQEQKEVTHIVFMGMGEPMLNLDAVLPAIEIITDPKRLGMSSRRITISTSGYVPQLKTLLSKGFKGNLAISLHAPNQQLREQLMPVAKSFSLDELMKVLDEFVAANNKEITYEYILIRDVNDRAEHVKELAYLLKHRLAHVNLIPYNPIQGADYQTPSRESVSNFNKALTALGVHNTIRVAMGADVNAACGQLAVSNKSN